MQQTVKSVRPTDGAATLVSGIESVTGTMNGQPLPPDALATIQKTVSTLVMTPTGKLVSMQMPAGSPMAGMGNITQSGTEAVLPTGPIHVGDTWKTAMNLGKLGMAVGMTSTLTGLDTTGGGAIATIAQTTNGKFHMTPPGMPATMAMQGTMTGTGTLHFNNILGAVQDQDTAMTMDMAPPSPAAGAAPSPLANMKMHMIMHMHMTRLPDTAPTPAP